MKFIHKISKITSYIIQICLLIFVLASNSLWGEVFALEGRSVKNADEFVEFLKRNTGEHPEGASLFSGTLATEMLGYGVFLHNNRKAGQVHVAKKHHGNSTAIHAPKSGGHILNRSFTEHTERQLIIQLIVKELNISTPIIERGRIKPRKPKIKHGRADITQEWKKNDKLLERLEGEFHIYTPAAPCSPRSPENNNFSCIDYYRELQQMLPNCKFHIYFKTADLDNNIPNDAQKTMDLIEGIKAMLKKSNRLGNYFQIKNGILQYNSTPNLASPQWKNIPQIIQQYINELRTIFNLAQRMVNDPRIKNRESILINLHNLTRTTYHTI